MDLNNLSSNWKQLQQTLNPDGSKKRRFSDKPRKTLNGNRPPLKREVHPTKHQQQDFSDPRKRRRANESGPAMGGYFSTPASAALTANEAYSTTSVDSVQNQETLGKIIALDCEMVGTTDPTPFSIKAHQQPISGKTEFSILARATLVNYNHEVLYDSYSLPPLGVKVTNYRTDYSGIREGDLEPSNPDTNPKQFTKIQKEIASLIDDRILVGHGLKNDLEVLGLSHPAARIRDTSRYPKYRKLSAVPGKHGRLGKGRTPALRALACQVLDMDIQSGGSAGHDSAEDARAAMALYIKEKKGFEDEARRIYGSAACRSKQRKLTTNGVTLPQEAEELAGIDKEEINMVEKADSQENDEDFQRASSNLSGEKNKKKKRGKKKSRTKR